ncbi:MAG: hypothetical protein HYU97_00545 [Deltaproteobacteria bacterium]|nr:hypothetical protein [Deltaproteobacteria bacterium]
MSLPNRLETQWPELKLKLQNKWDRLSDTDLEKINGHFDLLVKTLRNLYGGRIEIIQEAAIRDSLNEMLTELETNKNIV